MYVENPNQFSRMKFGFSNLSEVEKFWTELQAVCTTTPLNRRSYTVDDCVTEADYHDPDLDQMKDLNVEAQIESQNIAFFQDLDNARIGKDRGKNAEFIRKEWLGLHLR